MPTTTPQIKIDAVKKRGAREVVLAGDSYDEAYAHALELEKKQKLTFVHPYDDPDVIAGQGTIGMEILRQHPEPIDAVFCCIGGGGLISGVAAYIKRLRPRDARSSASRRADADAMARSLAAGKRVRLDSVGLFADGAAVKYVGDETFRLCQQYVDEMVLVDTDAICAAIKDVFEDTRSILEPAGALAVAGAKAWAKRDGRARQDAGGGGLRRQHELRPPALRRRARRSRRAARSRARRDDSREAGHLQEVLRLIGKRNITEFNYRYSDAQGGARLRRRAGGQPRRIAEAGRARCASTATRRSTSPTTRWPSCTCATWSAAVRRGVDDEIALSLRVPRTAGRADELPRPA